MISSSHLTPWALLSLALTLGACNPRQGQQPDTPASVLTVRTTPVQSQSWPATVEVNGPVRAWQELIASAQVGGLRIAELRVDVGATVRKGDLLALLDDRALRAELRKQQGVVAQAHASLEKAQSSHRRATAAAGSGALSEQQIEGYRIEAAQAQAALTSAQAELDSVALRLSHTRVLAMDDGVIASRSAVLGDTVNSGAELFRLIRQGRLEWQPELDSRQLAAVQLNQKAQVQLAEGRTVEGRVARIGPTLDEATGRARIYVALASDAALHAGLFARGTLRTGERDALTVPQTAVTLRDGRAYVWQVDAERKVHSQAVRTGRRQGERVEVLEGLDPKAAVVANGGGFLTEGARVTLADAVDSQVHTGAEAGR